jgi:hypothetical protein
VASVVVPVHEPVTHDCRTYPLMGEAVGLKNVCTYEQPLHPGIVVFVASMYPALVASCSWVCPVQVAFGSVFGQVDAVMELKGGTENTQSCDALTVSANERHVM